MVTLSVTVVSNQVALLTVIAMYHPTMMVMMVMMVVATEVIMMALAMLTVVLTVHT